MHRDIKYGINNLLYEKEAETQYAGDTSEFGVGLKDDLVALFGRIRGANKSNAIGVAAVDKMVANEAFTSVIYKHTKMRVELKTNRAYDISIGIPLFDMRLAISNDYNYANVSDSLDEMISRNYETIGGLDRTTGTVYGDITDFMVTLSLPLNEVVGTTGSLLSINGLVAIIIYELGHLHTSYKYASHVTLSSMTMINVLSRLSVAETEYDRCIIINEIQNEVWADIDVGDFEIGMKRSNAYYLTLLAVADKNKLTASFGECVYNERVIETLASDFATRHGIGSSLTNVLKTVNKVRTGVKSSVTHNLFSTVSPLTAGGMLTSDSSTTNEVTCGLVSYLMYKALICTDDENDDGVNQRWSNLKDRFIALLNGDNVTFRNSDNIHDDIKLCSGVIANYDKNE